MDEAPLHKPTPPDYALPLPEEDGVPEPAHKTRRTYTQAEIEANKHIYTQFDVNYVKQLNNAIFDILEASYFRPVYVGFDDMPERNNPDHPVIMASNHSGMAFPWDGMVFGCGLMKQFDYDPDKIFRVIIAPKLSGVPPMHPFFMKGSWRTSGGVDATFLNFETMMEYPNGHLLIYPEGVPGIGKGFNRKYQLQRFATSFIRMSLKHQTDILPYATVNAEYVVPYMYSIEWVNKQFQKVGVPYMALGIFTVFLIFPWAFYLAFPVKMFFVKGKRMSPYQWVNKPYEQLTDADIEQVRDRVKDLMQQDLDAAVEKYGHAPFEFKELMQKMWQNRRYFPYNTPVFWPFVFHEFERQWIFERKYITKERIDIPMHWGAIFVLIWRNPITLAYFIPIIGWFILIAYGKQRWKQLDRMGKPRTASNER
jgi:1-acyl-sn-glycerol-3-phosphate acyltransferase